MDGKSKPKIVEEEHQKEEKDVVPIKRKGFVEKINKKIIKKRENSKDKSISKESYSDLSIGNIDSICLMGTLKNFDSIKAQRVKKKLPRKWGGNISCLRLNKLLRYMNSSKI